MALDEEDLEAAFVFGDDAGNDDCGGRVGWNGHAPTIRRLRAADKACCALHMPWALVVVAGADQGSTWALKPGTFVVFGRSEKMPAGTSLVQRSLVRRLEEEDHQRMSSHLSRRFGQLPSGGLARGATADFERADDVDLNDDAVSQTHAIVFCDDAGFSVVDVASKNGTWVNGDRVHESILVPGDLLRLGETRLSLVAAPPTDG